MSDTKFASKSGTRGPSNGSSFRRTGRGVVVVAASIATAVCGLGAVAGPAHAAAKSAAPSAAPTPAPKLASGKWVSAGVTNPEGFTDMKPAQMGNTAHVFVSSNGDVGICAQDEKDAPSSGWYVIPEKHLPSVTYTKQEYIDGAYKGTEGEYTKAGLQQMAFIASHYAPPLDSPKAPLQYTAIDVADGIISGDVKEHQSPNAEVTAEAQRMMAEAKLYYGHQTVKFTKVPDKEKVGATTTIGVGAQSDATHNYVPDEKLTLTITGGTFADGSTTKKITTGKSPVDVKVKDNSPGEVKITAKGKVAAPGMWLQTNGEAQNIWVVGAKVDISGNTGWDVARTSVQPVVTTKASAVKGNVGDDLYDTVKGSGFPAGAKVTGTDALYRLPSGTKVTEGQDIPENAEKVADLKWSATADKDGNFEVKTDTYKVTKPGDYYWLESYNGGTSGSSQWAPGSGDFGDTQESTIVTGTSKLTVTTKANESKGNVGDTLTDTIIGSGPDNLAGAKVSGTDALYYMPYGSEVKPGQEIPDNAEKVADVKWTATVGKDGKFTTKAGNYKVTKPGNYYWVETLNAGQHNGWTWKSMSGKFGDTQESTIVTGRATIKVSTKANESTGNVGDTLTDTIIGSGPAALAGAKVNGTDVLYRVPMGTKVTPGMEVPDNAEKVADVKWSATVGKDGKFTTEAGNYKVTKPGQYYWVETLNAGEHGGYKWQSVTGKFGDSSESTFVKAPRKPAPPKPTPTPPKPIQQPIVQTG